MISSNYQCTEQELQSLPQFVSVYKSQLHDGQSCLFRKVSKRRWSLMTIEVYN